MTRWSVSPIVLSHIDVGLEARIEPLDRGRQPGMDRGMYRTYRNIKLQPDLKGDTHTQRERGGFSYNKGSL